MRILNERTQVKEAILNFRQRWGDGSYPADTRAIQVGAELRNLDPDKATADDIANLIGNRSWATPKACGECGDTSWDIVEIGESPDYESSTARLCKKCLMEGIRLLGGDYDPHNH